MSDINSQVNTYLYTAQMLADQVDDASNSGERRVLIVGASLSLKQAWESWLVELSSYLKIPSETIEDEHSETANILPDCQYLQALKRDSNSWYRHVSELFTNPLYFYEREMSKSPQIPDGSDHTRENLIAVSIVDSDDSQTKPLSEVVGELKAYIRHTREQQTEW